MKIDSDSNLSVDYYPFPTAHKPAAALHIGNKTLTEAYRLEQDLERLLSFYPGVTNPLKFEAIRLPYALIADADLAVRIDNQPYQAPEAIIEIHQQIELALQSLYASKGYTAGILTRLQRIDQRTAILQPVSYTDVMATNLIADVLLSDFPTRRKRGRGLWEESLRILDLLESNSPDADDLPPLEKSLLANPIGVAGIGLSSDNKLLIMHRAAHLSTYADVLGGTASGYVDWQDTTGATTLDDVLLHALKREIGEELSLEAGETGDFQRLGLYREFYRAGFVQAFYGFRVYMTMATLAERMTSTPHGEYQAMLAISADSPLSPTQARGKGSGDRGVKSLILSDKINQWTIGKELKGLLAAWELFGSP